MTRILKLENRSVIRLTGPDRSSLLQGLITNDIDMLSSENPLYAGLLTPQGKFLFDMIIVADGDTILLDIEAARKADLMRKLMMYKLRADVNIIDEPLSVWALFDSDAISGIIYPDPRHKSMHHRVIAAENPAPEAESMPHEDYEIHRLLYGIPDGSRDMIVEKYFWLETRAEALNGVSFSKGCYVGQELTARMKHRTSLKKQLVAIKALSGELQEGAALSNHTGKVIGAVKSTNGAYAIAYVRLEYLTDLLKTETATAAINDKPE